MSVFVSCVASGQGGITSHFHELESAPTDAWLRSHVQAHINYIVNGSMTISYQGKELAFPVEHRTVGEPTDRLALPVA